MGLWQLTQLLGGLDASKALLVVGDATSSQIAPGDRAVEPLFGDAVSVTAVEKDASADDLVFSLGNDGAGAPYLIQPHGGAKAPHEPPKLFMDGTQVFVFTLREVPRSIKECLEAAGWTHEDVDYAVLHQANAMMLQHLGQKPKFTRDQIVIAMADVGNTSSASIPLALCMGLADEAEGKPLKLLMSGFGVGWSWATVAISQSPMAACYLIDLQDRA